MVLLESVPSTGCPWPPLVSGRLVKRYKRFLADMILDAAGSTGQPIQNASVVVDLLHRFPGWATFIS